MKINNVANAYSYFINKISDELEDHELSCIEIAHKIHVAPATIYGMKNFEHVVNFEIILKLCKFLNLDITIKGE